MSKVRKPIPVCIIVFTLLSCPAFSSPRVEEPTGKHEARVFWVLDGTMSSESAEMYLERFLLPTSLATMLWTEFSLQGTEVTFETAGGYRVLRKQKVLADPIGPYTVFGYDVIVDAGRPAGDPPGRRRAAASYTVSFSYTSVTTTASGVIAQPLQQALLAGIREDRRSSGRARVESIDYLGSGRFKATVLIGD